SSLAFHYVADVARPFATLARALVPGGRLVFSIEHPVFMAPRVPDWREGDDGRRIWPLDDYGREGERRTDWLAPGVVKYDRTFGTTMNALIGAGFSVAHVEDWVPSPAQLAADPMLASELDRPTFLIVAATR